MKEDEKSKLLTALRGLDPEAVRAILQEGLTRRRLESEARRTLTGIRAPPSFPCKSCKGTVKPVIRYDSDRRLGGPPPKAHLVHFMCDDCGLLYGKPPKKAETPEETPPPGGLRE